MSAKTNIATSGFWARLGHWLRAIDAAFDHDPRAALEQRVGALEARLGEPRSRIANAGAEDPPRRVHRTVPSRPA